MLSFSFELFLCICIFSEILISNNISFAILPYSYIMYMDGILLE